MDDSVRSLPIWTELALGQILRPWSYLLKDEVTDVKFFQLHPSIVVFSYLLLVLGHPLRSLISYLVQKVQVLLQLVVVVLLVEKLPPETGEPYFDRDDCFCAVGQVKRCLPCCVRVVVLYAHSTFGNSSGHAPFAPTNRDLISLSKDWLVTSVCPLAWGCPGDEYLFLMPKFEQKDLNARLSN